MTDALAKEAKKRQEGSRPRKGEQGFHVPINLSAHEKGDTRDQAAKIVGVSPAMIDRAETVADKGAPELQEAVARGEIETTVAKDLTGLPARG